MTTPTIHITSLKHLANEIYAEISKNGYACDLNHLDVSQLTSLANLFSPGASGYNLENFNGDISKWDVSNVTDLTNAFAGSSFNGDISQWNVRNVKTARELFKNSAFEGDISEWTWNSSVHLRDAFRNAKSPKRLNWLLSGDRVQEDVYSMLATKDVPSCIPRFAIDHLDQYKQAVSNLFGSGSGMNAWILYKDWTSPHTYEHAIAALLMPVHAVGMDLQALKGLLEITGSVHQTALLWEQTHAQHQQPSAVLPDLNLN